MGRVFLLVIAVAVVRFRMLEIKYNLQQQQSITTTNVLTGLIDFGLGRIASIRHCICWLYYGFLCVCVRMPVREERA